MNLKTSIIIVNYNTTAVLRDCIESIFKFEKHDNFEIIIIDNDSKEDSQKLIEELKKEYNNINSIYLTELKSYSNANNRGIECSNGEFILIMNPDIIFVQPLFENIISQFNINKKIGAIAPALIGIDGKLQKFYYQKYPTIKQFIFFHSMILRFFYKTAFFVNRYQIDNRINLKNKNTFFVEHIPGAFFFTSRNVLNEVGLMDENFMLFYEDTDLSYRIRKKFELVVDTSMQIRHLGGTSFKEMQWWIYGRFISSMIYFFKKHYSNRRFKTLKNLSVFNAKCILFIEKILKLFGKKNEFRIKKYNNFLNLVKEI